MAGKKRKKRYGGVTAVILIIAVLAAGLVWNGQKGQKTEASGAANDTFTEAAVTRGDISETVIGSGNLAHADAEDVKAPSGITITEVLISEGDTVTEGDIVATADRDSVEKAIRDTQDSIDSLDSSLQEISGDDTGETVSSAVAGRVKRIYAEDGDEAADVMDGHGALLVISTDGLLKAVIENAPDDLKDGEECTVRFADGTEADAEVSEIRDGSAVVTTSDDGPDVGDAVTVIRKESDAVIGSGTLEINSPYEAVAMSGTVREVYVSENDRVSRYDSLLYLDDVDNSSEKKDLLSEREDLTERLTKLIAVRDAGGITSDRSGIVETIRMEDDTELGGASAADASAVGNAGTGSAASAGGMSGGYSSAAYGTAGSAYAAGSASDTAAASGASAENGTGSANGSEDVTAFTVTSDQTMDLVISVDELDILEIEEGQPVSVEVDAIGEERFDGTVTDIDPEGTNSGGSTKYSVTVEVPMRDGMMVGMSATATVIVRTAEDVLTIPAQALYEDGDGVYVYTSYDRETGELTGKTEVTTGLSTDSLVEITEGLADGENVYYEELSGEAIQDDTLETAMNNRWNGAAAASGAS